MNSDIFVLYDLAQYNKQDFQNRNVLNNKGNAIRIMIPVKKHPYNTMMQDIKICNSINWQERIKRQIYNCYQKEPYFKEVISFVSIIWNEPWDNLCSLNFVLIQAICNYLGIKTKLVLTSSLPLDKKFSIEMNASEKLLEICKVLKTKHYISGSCGAGYLDENLFVNERINVWITEFTKTKENYSILDYLFKYGKETLKIISGFGHIKPFINERIE